ncbi:MAG: thioesterase [Lachnospiraceae bacterium]|nr:thioesterase [Lachnospiraceae bacterium]
MKYTFNSKIRYNEIGPDGCLKLGGLVDYFQDCAVFHSMSIGFGPDLIQGVRSGWMIVAWRIFVRSYPRLGDDVRIETWGHRFRTAEGDRNFRLLSPEGRVYAEADSRFIYVDTALGRPTAPPEEEKQGYGIEPALELKATPRHVVLPEAHTAGEPFPVLPSHIDTNRHVNNRQYIDMALNYLPARFTPHEIYVDYHTQARLGDTILPKLYEDEERYIISLDAESGRAYCVSEFRK